MKIEINDDGKLRGKLPDGTAKKLSLFDFTQGIEDQELEKILEMFEASELSGAEPIGELFRALITWSRMSTVVNDGRQNELEPGQLVDGFDSCEAGCLNFEVWLTSVIGQAIVPEQNFRCANTSECKFHPDCNDACLEATDWGARVLDAYWGLRWFLKGGGSVWYNSDWADDEER